MNDKPVVPPRRGRPPKARPIELPPDKQLATIMDQITLSSPASINPDLNPDYKAPTATNDSDFVEDAQPAAEQHQQAQLKMFDIVQVVNPESPAYGVVFIVGATHGTSVHGFYLAVGARKQYVTVDLSDLTNDKGMAIYGEARIKSRQPVSQQWKDEYGQTN